MNKPVSPEEALVFVMVMASAVDNAMAEKELVRIGQLIDILPVFDNFDKERLIEVSQRCANLLSGPEGLDIALDHGVCNEPSFLNGLEDMPGVIIRSSAIPEAAAKP